MCATLDPIFENAFYHIREIVGRRDCEEGNQDGECALKWCGTYVASPARIAEIAIGFIGHSFLSYLQVKEIFSGIRTRIS